MATTMYFEETIQDQGGSTTMDLEFGRSSFYHEDSIYFVIDGKTIIVDRKTAAHIAEQMQSLAQYLSLDQT